MPFVSYVPLERAKAMVDAVNNAVTQQQHYEARLRLDGYVRRCEELGQRWPCVGLDLSAEEPDRPMCCGIYNDWQPQSDDTGEQR